MPGAGRETEAMEGRGGKCKGIKVGKQHAKGQCSLYTVRSPPSLSTKPVMVLCCHSVMHGHQTFRLCPFRRQPGEPQAATERGTWLTGTDTSSEHRQPEIKPEAGTDTQLTGQQPRPSHPRQPGAPCAALTLAPCQGAAGRVSCTTRAPLTALAPSVDTFQRLFFIALQISAGQLSGILVAFILIRILRG